VAEPGNTVCEQHKALIVGVEEIGKAIVRIDTNVVWIKESAKILFEKNDAQEVRLLMIERRQAGKNGEAKAEKELDVRRLAVIGIVISLLSAVAAVASCAKSFL
jgi:hypothetical protein